MRNTILAGLLLLPVVSHAAVYRLENPVYPVGVDYAARLSVDPADFFGRHPITLKISDAAVQRGSFDYRSTFSYGRHVSGDVGDFISFSLIDGPPGDAIYAADIDLKFDASGLVTGGRLFYSADTVGISLTCSGIECSGYSIIGASTMYHAPISGELLDLASVPEPDTVELIFTALGALAFGKGAKRLLAPKASRWLYLSGP